MAKGRTPAKKRGMKDINGIIDRLAVAQGNINQYVMMLDKNVQHLNKYCKALDRYLSKHFESVDPEFTKNMDALVNEISAEDEAARRHYEETLIKKQNELREANNAETPNPEQLESGTSGSGESGSEPERSDVPSIGNSDVAT